MRNGMQQVKEHNYRLTQRWRLYRRIPFFDIENLDRLGDHPKLAKTCLHT